MCPCYILLRGALDGIERFSIECRKTKTKVIKTTNQNKGKNHKETIRTQSKYNVNSLKRGKTQATKS